MKRIKLLALLMLSIAFGAKAQIVYVDINPDLNGATWTQTVLGTTFTTWGGSSAIATNPYDLANPRCMIVAGSGDEMAILNTGNMIGPTSSWNGDAWFAGTPPAITDKYLGFRVGTAGSYRYGWFKVSRTAGNAGVWTVKDYAYQNTLNTAIAAGDMGGPVTAPVAGFSGNPLVATTNTTNVTFTDQSTNAPTSWAWTFTPNTVTYQAGTTAASQNPQVKFTAAGTYSVQLVATNAGGSNTHNKPNYVTVTNPAPPAAPVTAFTANQVTATTNITNITFTDQSTNTPTSWAWTFTPNTVTYQGGTTAASQNPQVKFTAPGTYSVQLVSTNAGGTNTLNKPNYITVSNPAPPVAAFTGNPLNATTNVTTVTLTDQATGTPTSRIWTITPNTVTYQAGTSAASQNPQLKFTVAGTYTVKLKVANANGADSLTKTNYINVQDPAPAAPVAAFMANNIAPVATITAVTFTDQSLNAPTSRTWSFVPNTVIYQAGTNANSANPQVVFNAAGAYTAKLVVSNAFGADSTIKVSYINAVAPPAPLAANFSADVTTAVANTTVVSLTDLSTGFPDARKWTITPNTFVYQNSGNSTIANPKVVFTAAGDYTIKLKVSNNSGGKDSITKMAYIRVTGGSVTAVADVSRANKVLNVYPNPADDFLSFELIQDARIQKVSVVNLEGKVVATYNQVKGNSINVAALSKGMYFLKIEFEKESKAEFKKFSKL